MELRTIPRIHRSVLQAKKVIMLTDVPLILVISLQRVREVIETKSKRQPPGQIDTTALVPNHWHCGGRNWESTTNSFSCHSSRFLSHFILLRWCLFGPQFECLCQWSSFGEMVRSKSLLSLLALMMRRAGLPLTKFVYVAALIASLAVVNTRLYICVTSILITC